MRGNKKSRQSHHRQTDPSSAGLTTTSYGSGNATTSSSSNNNSNKSSLRQLDFSIALQEVSVADGRRQMTIFLLGIIMSVVLSTLMGTTIGMALSVHYFESQNPVASGNKMNPRDSYLLYSGPSAYQKVTTLDPEIAASNIVQKDRDGLDLGKVITTSASGQLNVLMVVQEETPLHAETMNDPFFEAASGNTTEYTQGSRRATPMTMEQAEDLLPGYSKWRASQPRFELREPSVLPTLCSDGVTFGFNDWNTLRSAVQEANSISAERFMKWSEYFATNTFTAFYDDNLYYEEDVVFTICPGAILRARKGPIMINAENVVLECDGTCIIDVGGTHLTFGSNAKNVLVRGITFKGASSSSLTFFHDGADASFEDCSWINNRGQNNKFGSVADINSTSIVNFHRCEIGLAGRNSFTGTAAGTTSSLSIRA
jgi:hypothetical protein